MKRTRCLALVAAVLSLGLMLGLSADASAACDHAQSCSTNYSVNETYFGIGGNSDCATEKSTNYCAKTSVGEIGAGSGKSDNYSAQFGFNTSDVPMLEVIAIGGVQDMGVLQTYSTGTAVYSVKVRNYLSSGYVLQITGPPPSQGSHSLGAPSSPTASQQGTEQFGINLTDNSTPNIGAGPVQVPSGSFSFGHVTSNYSQADKFMYQDGDTVAQSTSSTGETDYTVSMVANISNVTAAGRYNGEFSAVVVPTF